MKISVVGIGYVGLATAVLWAARHEVCALDVVQQKVDAVNRQQAPFKDSMIPARLAELAQVGTPLLAKLNESGALCQSDMVIIAVPTNYDEETKCFDTGIVEGVLEQIARECPDALVVLRSTVQPGATEKLASAYGVQNILYCPEFLREGRSFEDCLHPSRLVIGAANSGLADRYLSLVTDVYRANGVAVPTLVTCPLAEAETAKLFSNAFLATRVAFFNELDSFALDHGLDASKIIEAVCLDERIGSYYNNPSFGYGGYCLPKDTKALKHSFGGSAPSSIVSAAIDANAVRKVHLADYVASLAPKRVGVYRLVAKHDSDNLRSSALVDIVKLLVERGLDVLVYEPLIEDGTFSGAVVTHDLQRFFKECDLVIANRMSPELADYQGALFTRDLYQRD